LEFLEIAYESRRQRFRLTEGKQVTARELFHVQAQPVLGYAALALLGEEPIATARENGGAYARPAR